MNKRELINWENWKFDNEKHYDVSTQELIDIYLNNHQHIYQEKRWFSWSDFFIGFIAAIFLSLILFGIAI